MASRTTNSMTPFEPPPSNDKIAAVLRPTSLLLAASDAAATSNVAAASNAALAAVVEDGSHPEDLEMLSSVENIFLPEKKHVSLGFEV